MPKTTTKKSKSPATNGVIAHSNIGQAKTTRLNVQKTYKLYIGGKFPRTESGRYFKLKAGKEVIANICQGSRKDFREAVVAGRGAFAGWAGKTAFNRGQIIYRIAEILEGRSAQFVSELVLQGSTEAEATLEVNTAIDRLVYYAGWADKYQQIFSSVNPVSSSHFNFSLCEPTGVVSIIAPEKPSLLGLVSTIVPIITGGNTCVVLSSESQPLSAITFSEVLHASDVPGGVVNIITGFRNELAGHFSSHMDVNAILYCGSDKKEIQLIQENATVNVKRVLLHKDENWFDEKCENPYEIRDAQEIKTTWHPIGY